METFLTKGLHWECFFSSLKHLKSSYNRAFILLKEDSERVGKEIRDFILKQTGLDTPVEIIEHIIGMNDRPIDEFLLDTAGGAAKDKAVNLKVNRKTDRFCLCLPE
jgi:hypothetical protein